MTRCDEKWGIFSHCAREEMRFRGNDRSKNQLKKCTNPSTEWNSCSVILSLVNSFENISLHDLVKEEFVSKSAFALIQKPTLLLE